MFSMLLDICIQMYLDEWHLDDGCIIEKHEQLPSALNCLMSDEVKTVVSI